MDKIDLPSVAIASGLIAMVLGLLFTIRSAALQNRQEALEKITRVIEFMLLIGLTGAIANAIQNELIRICGNSFWGFLIGGVVSALLLFYRERLIDVFDKLLESQRINLGIILFLIGLSIEVSQLYIAITFTH